MLRITRIALTTTPEDPRSHVSPQAWRFMVRRELRFDRRVEALTWERLRREARKLAGRDGIDG